jgi:hypothetical protein
MNRLAFRAQVTNRPDHPMLGLQRRYASFGQSRNKAIQQRRLERLAVKVVVLQESRIV